MVAGGQVRRWLMTTSAVLGLASCSLVLDFSGSPGSSSADGGARDGAQVPNDGPTVPPGADAAPDAIALDASPYCRPGSTDVLDPDTRSCYLFLEFAQSYAIAEENCRIRGGAHLATLTSEREYELVYARMLAAPYWLGLTDAATEGTFAWNTGEPLSFTNWRTGEPNEGNGGEDCAVMYGPYVGEYASYAGFWNDSLCPEELWAVCELELSTRD